MLFNIFNKFFYYVCHVLFLDVNIIKMQNSYVIKLLKTLNSREFRKLSGFIDSPFISLVSRRTVSINRTRFFFRYIKQYYPKFINKNLDRKIIFNEIFPHEVYDERKFRNTKLDISRTIEMFIACSCLISDPYKIKTNLLEHFKKKREEILYEQNINLCNGYLEDSNIRDESFYYQKYLLTNMKRLFYEHTEELGKSELNFRILQDEINYISSHFIIVLLKQLSLKYHFKTHLNIELDTEFYEYIYDYFNLNKEKFRDNKVIFLLNKFLLIHKENTTPGQIKELMSLLNSNSKLFYIDDFKYLYIDLISFCISRYSKGEIEFKNILNQLLKDCIEKGVYVQEGYIHEHNYKNIVRLALRLKNPKMAENFINDYKEKLPAEQRENAYLFTYSTYYYTLKNYGKALELLSKVESKDFYYSTEIYNLQLRIYYEINATESALNMIDSYKHFFAKHKLIPGEYKRRFKMFLKNYEKLVRIKLNKSKTPPGLLIRKLNEYSDFSYKNWLINKLKELEY